MTAATIETFTGKWFDILNPQPEQIDIESIAHAEAMICRFTGHVKYFYSVGQHSWLGSYLVPDENALEFLLHDASEAFIGDMSRPLKHLTAAGGPYREVEKNIMAVIRAKFGLPSTQSDIIHKIDNQMLYAEKNQLMSSLEWTKASREGCECPDMTAAAVTIHEMSPREIETKFLERYHQLTESKKEN
jgi:uncharacterized protein